MIIGLCGQIGAGKDTFFEWLVDLGIIAKKQMAFANEVKREANIYHNVPISSNEYGAISIEKNPRVRKLLQKIGNDRREQNPNYWIDKVFEQINDEKNYGITDVRHLNEAEAILERDGVIIYLDVDSSLRKERIQKRDNIEISEEEWTLWHQHPSESEVLDIAELHADSPNFIRIFQKDNNFHTNKNLLIAKLKLIQEAKHAKELAEA